jgi:hypothetical protein
MVDESRWSKSFAEKMRIGRERWKRENIERLKKERAAAAEEASRKLEIMREEMRRKSEESRAKSQEPKLIWRTENLQEELPMTTKNEVEKIQSVTQEIIPESLAKVFYASGIFKDIKSEAQAVVKILAGREMGLSPIQSMTNVFVLDNKVGYETKVFLSKVKKSGRYDYAVRFTYGDDKKLEACDVTFSALKKDDWVEIGTSNFSVYDAARLGLINKSNYKNYLNLMLFYRAASNGIKMFCPDILDGAALKEEYQEVLSEGKEDVAEEISLEGLDNE